MTSAALPVLQDAVRCLALAVIALILGWSLNSFRAKPLPLLYQSKEARIAQAVAQVEGTAPSAAPELSKEGGLLSLDEFRAFVEGKKGMILDARDELFYRDGHVPGAINFPREDFQKAYATWKSKLEADKNQPLAVYCSDETCPDSTLVRQGLVDLGYTRVYLFKGGWDEWTRGHLPEEPKP